MRTLPGQSVRRRASLPALYEALFEIAAMRASVGEIREELSGSEAERFTFELDLIEGVALSLLDAAELRADVVAH